MKAKYFLSPTAISQLREHKKWSLEHFGRSVTKKYFEDIDKGFKYIADNQQRLPKKPELTANTELSIYPICEHYVVYISLSDGIYIAAVLGQAQDIPNILNENNALFQREFSEIYYKNKA